MIEEAVYKIFHSTGQGCNAKKVNCSCVYSVYILMPINKVNKNRCLSFRLISEEVKTIAF